MFPMRVDDLDVRPFAASDTDAFFALLSANRAHLDPWMRWTAFVQTRDDARAYIQRAADTHAAGTGFHAGIWRDGDLLGGFACRDIDRNSRHAEIGYWLGAAYVGQGIIQRVARAAISELFTRERMHRIEIQAMATNSPSRAVAERLGFTFEGIKRESEWITDAFQDHALYSLLAHEWTE